MNLESVLEYLRAERDRFDRAIRELERTTPKPRPLQAPQPAQRSAPVRQTLTQHPSQKTREIARQVFQTHLGQPMTIRELVPRLVDAGLVSRHKNLRRDLSTQLPKWAKGPIAGLKRVPKTNPQQWVYQPQGKTAWKPAPNERQSWHYAVEALQKAGRPLSYTELADAMKHCGWPTKATNPSGVIGAMYTEWMRKDRRLIRPSKGQLSVRNGSPTPTKKTRRVSPVKHETSMPVLFERVLPVAPNGVTPSEALTRMQAAGWTSNSPTPLAVLRARLREYSRAVRVDDNPVRWGLRPRNEEASA
jgi:hypothetical protein